MPAVRASPKPPLGPSGAARHLPTSGEEPLPHEWGKVCPGEGVRGDEKNLGACARDAEDGRQRALEHHRGRHHLPRAEQREAAGQDLTAVIDRMVVQDVGGAADLEPVRAIHATRSARSRPSGAARHLPTSGEDRLIWRAAP
jgi:hypothetical protein